MTAPLSDDARAIAGGLFGLPSCATNAVRYERPWDITPQAAAAFAELVDAGIITCRVSTAATTYVQATDCRHHYDWLRSVMHTGVGRFPLTIEGERR